MRIHDDCHEIDQSQDGNDCPDDDSRNHRVADVVPHEEQEGVDGNDDYPELGRSKLGISQSEFGLEVGIDADIKREHQIEGKSDQRQFEIEKRRKARAHEHE